MTTTNDDSHGIIWEDPPVFYTPKDLCDRVKRGRSNIYTFLNCLVDMGELEKPEGSRWKWNKEEFELIVRKFGIHQSARYRRQWKAT